MTPPIAGTVVESTPLYVELDRRPGGRIGPCRAEPRRLPVATADGHVHNVDAGPPPIGTTCLIVFADGDERQPWVVAFDGWPTTGAP